MHKALAYNPFDMTPPCHPTEIDIKIHYIIYEGDAPSIYLWQVLMNNYKVFWRNGLSAFSVH
jgi:hypothetical protein